MSIRPTLEFSSIDPSTGQEVARYESASQETVEAAARAAQAAYLDDKLRDPSRRCKFLTAVAARLRTDAGAIVALAQQETALSTSRLEGELERTASQLDAFSDLIRRGDYVDAHIDEADPTTKPLPRPDVRRMLVPIGPVAVFGAGNFPLAFSTAGGDTASAIAAGCPVIFKGHPAHPGTSERVASILRDAGEKAGLPAGTFAHLTAAGSAVGQWLVDCPEVSAVAFTGSFDAGMSIYRAAAARPVPIPVFAEMGSLNPLVVTRAALLKRGSEIAADLAAAVAGSGGQLCTKPGLVFVPSGYYGDTFASKTETLLEKHGTHYLLSSRIKDALLAQTSEIERVAESHAPQDGEPTDSVHMSSGYRVQARLFSVDAETFSDSPEIHQECFGPVCVFVRYADFAQLQAAFEKLGGQLTATLHFQPEEADSVRPIVALMERLAGRLVFNGFPTGVSVTPAMHHGGPFPATSNSQFSSVGDSAIYRFLRPVAFQNAPSRILPEALRDANPAGISRTVNGHLR